MLYIRRLQICHRVIKPEILHSTTEIKKYIAEKYKKPGDVFLGVVHRLDRPVSGVILYARTSKALSRLNEMFRTKEVKKIYLAIVKERPPEDEGSCYTFP